MIILLFSQGPIGPGIVTACREQILAKIAALLNTEFGGTIVYRAKEYSVSEADLPIIAIFDAGLSPEYFLTGERDWSVAIQVQVICSGSTRLAAEQDAYEKEAIIHRVLFGNISLDGIAHDLRPGDQPEPLELDLDAVTPICNIPMGFRVFYATRETDMTTFA